MSTKSTTKLVREGDLAAEVGVELRADAGDWSPTISIADATKLDEVRAALRSGDIPRALQLADRVYRLTPVDSQPAR